MPCEGKKHIMLICGGVVTICGDTLEELEAKRAEALRNDERCLSIMNPSLSGGSDYAKFAPPGDTDTAT